MNDNKEQYVSTFRMHTNGSKQQHVSTFRMDIRSPCGSPAKGNGSGTTSHMKTSGPTNDLDTVTDKGCDRRSPARRLEPPLFTQPIEDCSVDEGSNITLRGVLTGSQPIRVSWLHNGEVAYFGKPFSSGSEVSFVVKECLPEDAGAYTCLAENRVGKTSCCAAVFVRDFETIRGDLGTTAKKTLPLSNTIMENGGPPLYPSIGGSGSPTSPSLSSNQSPGVTPTEAIPKKRKNSATGSAVQFKNPPQHIEVREGQTARLTCSFTGSAPVVSCWITNKEQIVDCADVWTESSDQSSTLVISEAQTRHTGRYTVVVKDRKSSAQHTVTLSVVEQPQPPASCPLVSIISASSLVLSWSGPSYDGGSVVLGYVIEAKSQGPTEPGDWRELTSQCKSTSYRVSSGLRPQVDYWFRVRAYNAVGVSEPSQESQLVRMEHEEKPQGEESFQTYKDVTVDSTHKVTDHYNKLEKLGVGKFGQVFKLTHKVTGHVCAGKFYKGRRAKEREAARKEIELMNHLHHNKLVQCLAAYDHKPEMVMVMEFIAGGELFERIVDDNFEHTEPASVRYMQQILEGIGYMHEKNIVHLDIKPENIVCVDHTGTSIKIIDFGLANTLDPKTPLKVMHGTPEFVAPEVISYDPVCLATDMWSIGVICYILLSGESPFQGNSDEETLAAVTAAQWEFDEESFEDITEQAQNFISSLLSKDSRRRMSWKEALAHPWMAMFNSVEPGTTKSLSKEKMKRFLARQKWKKAGKAMLALKRMALLSKGDGHGSPTSSGEECPLTPETEQALQALEIKMQGAPQFSQRLQEQTVTRGSSARLSCHLQGYPDPEVIWLCGEQPVVESTRVQIEYEDDGHCTLVLAQVDPGDANIYTCKATNDQGEAVCSAKLIVKE